MAALKVYADRVSEPVRAVILFCKLNGIEFEEVKIDLFKHENHSPEYAAINPMKTVPAIAHGDFKLLESHAILIYLASAFPGVADHWYPADLFSRAKLHSVLDWHHSNLRCGALGYVINSVLAPRYGLSLNPQTAAECDKILVASLSKIESFWLQGNGKFLLGNDQPSIADLSLVSEIMQLEVLEEKERIRILDPFKKVQRWIQDVKDATRPHFDEVHEVLFETAAIIDKQRAENI
ncbi:Glutathione S-transferase theta-1 [Ancistrocladus abbreviatus]